VVAVLPRDDGLSDPGYGVFNQVVVPTDGTAIAERAATHSLRVAERYGADVRVVYVVDTTIHELPYEDGSFPFVLTWKYSSTSPDLSSAPTSSRSRVRSPLPATI
jgi:nucleotide-binding universal stress UspA family protein